MGKGDTLEKGMATPSIILAWEIPWTEEPRGLQSLGSQRELQSEESGGCGEECLLLQDAEFPLGLRSPRSSVAVGETSCGTQPPQDVV